MYTRIAIPTLLFFALVGSPTSHADKTTESAQKGLAELRFEDARSIALKGLKEGTRGPENVSTLYMILGQVSASLGDDADAEEAFRAALSLDGEASLPEGVSPKLSEPFSRAKASLEDEQPIKLLSELAADGQLSVQIASDPAKLVGGVEASYQLDGAPKTKRAKGTGTIRLELPSGIIKLEVALTDAHGNQLTSPEPVDVGEIETNVVMKDDLTSPTASPPIYKRWQLYAGLAIGSFATGAYYGNASRSKTDEIAQLEDGTEFSVAQDLEDQAKKRALYANIGFAAGAALGAAAVWMFLSEAPTPEAPLATAIVPMVDMDRLGVAAHVSF